MPLWDPLSALSTTVRLLAAALYRLLAVLCFP
jgi:hypothetical protein